MANYQWKPLTDEKKFEDLINDLCSAKYGLEFQIYGRKGQKQYGIDGFVSIKKNEYILYQCKNKDISRSSKIIKNELLRDLETETNAMIKKFIGKKSYIVKKFIFAHSWKRDKDLQNKANDLNSNVIVWSWDEISDMLEEYQSIAQKYYPKFFIDKNLNIEITQLSNEKSFLDEIFHYIQREEPVMLLSMTSTPYHNKIAKYYKEKIYNLAIERYGQESVFSIHPPTKKNIDESKYFSKLAKQCGFLEAICDSYEFIEEIENRLEVQDVFLLISEFENGSDIYRKNLALEFRTLFSNSYEYSFYVVIFGRKKLAQLKYEENEDGNSPLNYFYDFLLPTPTIEDYKQLESKEEDINDIYNLTGGHPELMSFCLKQPSADYKELILESYYGAKFFQKYRNRKERLLKLFNQKSFDWFSIWSDDPLLHKLFWDNLIVEDGNSFKWIAPIVAELGKRYFR